MQQVRGQPFGELLRVASRYYAATADIIRVDAQPAGGHPTLDLRQGELVLAGDEHVMGASGQSSKGYGSLQSAPTWSRPACRLPLL
ncbi:hypothetical protein M2302_006621 [Micromonospora sp. A200]|uniref:hypothetical protein n=1 Tax=Micromonospora sp. A200 TaxID=2940568 RepID=UPI002473AE68|nr:hypothetical protein [Micromonospora sp. A200]MDH6466413.1 hypothetical protein [Micromonospora sp. A200]